MRTLSTVEPGQSLKVMCNARCCVVVVQVCIAPSRALTGKDEAPMLYPTGTIPA
jgi:hypothetical protein